MLNILQNVFDTPSSLSFLKPLELPELIDQLDQLWIEIREKLNIIHQNADQLKEFKKSLDTREYCLSLEEEEWEHQKQKALKMYHLSDEVIDLNVGGENFTTLHTTLTKISDSMLGSMFSGRFPITTDHHGRCFIDRDPKIFRIVLNFLRTGKWFIPDNEEKRRALRVELDYLGLIPILQGRIYLIGGGDETHRLTLVNYYDITDNSWNTITELTQQRAWHSSVLAEGKIYVFGGMDDQEKILNNVECLDPYYNEWTTLAPMTVRRQAPASQYYQGYIYVFGGRDEDVVTLNTMEIFSIEKGSWKNGVGMIHCRGSLGSAVYNGCLFALGGFTEEHGILNSVEKYEISKNSWNLVRPMSIPRFGLVSCALNNRIYVIGGQQDSGVVLDSVEVYDPIHDIWSTSIPLPNKRTALACTASSNLNLIYIFGGYDGDNWFRNNSSFSTDLQEWSDLPSDLPSSHTAGTALLLE